jgi:hypothetical protein
LNRGWIDRVKPLLEMHETTLGDQLPRLFQKPWDGLPFRVDVVQTASYSGANAASPSDPTLHILVSSTHADNQGVRALEVVFHEASHFLATNESPLGTALVSAARESGRTSPPELLHQVHFFLTGEAVRRAIAGAARRTRRICMR